MMESSNELKQVVEYMAAHWPSEVKEEWQVGLAEYPEILKKVLADLTEGKSRERNFVRIAGLSGSGKTSQILPAVEAYFSEKKLEPVLVAARRFVEYHPHLAEIREEYGEENVRKKTDEFSTIMMFMVMKTLTELGYDIVLDVTLLDPVVEGILIKMLKKGKYQRMLLMIATSPVVTEHFLGGRGWRHSKATEEEFIRATFEALKFYAENDGELRAIIWSVYDLLPVYDGPVKDGLLTFRKYSEKTEMPRENDDERKERKAEYMRRVASGDKSEKLSR